MPEFTSLESGEVDIGRPQYDATFESTARRQFLAAIYRVRDDMFATAGNDGIDLDAALARLQQDHRGIYDAMGEVLKRGKAKQEIKDIFMRDVIYSDGRPGHFAYPIPTAGRGYVYKRWGDMTLDDYEAYRAMLVSHVVKTQARLQDIDARFDEVRDYLTSEREMTIAQARRALNLRPENPFDPRQNSMVNESVEGVVDLPV